MIVDYKTFNLFGKQLFEKAIITSPHEMPSRMPESACFIYLIEGECKAYGPDKMISIKKRESVLLKCGNYVYKTPIRKESDLNESIAIHFDLEVLKKVYDKEFPALLKKTQPSGTSQIIEMGTSLLVDKYIQDLLFYFKNPSLVNDDMLILKFKEIILLLLQTEYAPKLREVFSNLLAPAKFNFREVIETHLYNDLSNEELATLTNRSLTSFKREFKKIYNDTPSHYIIKRRIDTAKEKLELTEDSISAIAFDCGFKDLSHFSKSFRQRYKLSPSEYRMDFQAKS